MRINNPLSKTIIGLQNKFGYGYHHYFNWLIDDVLAGFGIKPRDEVPECCRKTVFDLTTEYANMVRQGSAFEDLLGSTYMDLVNQYGQKALGQYFTPSPIAVMMSKMLIDLSLFDQKPIVRICDPAVGSGVMTLSAAAHVLAERGEQGLKQLSITGIDLDNTCARIFACQMLSNLFVHNLELAEVLVFQGNSLANPDNLNLLLHATGKNMTEEQILDPNAFETRKMIQQSAKIAAQMNPEKFDLFDEAV